MNSKLMSQLSKGTKTFHLPAERSATRPPEMTLVVRQLEDGRYEAGVSICSHADQFSKARGRTIALERLQGKPITAASSKELFDILRKGLWSNHANLDPHSLVSGPARADLYKVCNRLDEIFTKVKERRQAIAVDVLFQATGEELGTAFAAATVQEAVACHHRGCQSGDNDWDDPTGC